MMASTIAARPQSGGYNYPKPSVAFDEGYSSSSSSYSSSSGSYPSSASYSSGSGFGSDSSVQKHVYVYAPPPEPEYRQAQRQQPHVQPRKTYKIIFIKTPAFPTPAPPVVPQSARNEERTIVYVLVRRPENAEEFNIPTPAPTEPSKPEVYFIRYKAQKSVAGASGGGFSSSSAGGGFNDGPTSYNLGGSYVGGGSRSGGRDLEKFQPPRPVYGVPDF